MTFSNLIDSIPASKLFFLMSPEKCFLDRALCSLEEKTHGFEEGNYLFMEKEDFKVLGLENERRFVPFIVLSKGGQKTLTVMMKSVFGEGAYKKIHHAVQSVLGVEPHPWKDVVVKDFSTDENSLPAIINGYAMQQELQKNCSDTTCEILSPIISEKGRGVYVEEFGGSQVSFNESTPLLIKLMIMSKILKTLDYVHSKIGRIHADFKWDNIVGEGLKVKIIDWDLSTKIKKIHSSERVRRLDIKRFYYPPSFTSIFMKENKRLGHSYLQDSDIWGLISMFGYDNKTQTLDEHTIDCIFTGMEEKTNNLKEKDIYKVLKDSFSEIIRNSSENWGKSDFEYYSAGLINKVVLASLRYLAGTAELPSFPEPDLSVENLPSCVKISLPQVEHVTKLETEPAQSVSR